MMVSCSDSNCKCSLSIERGEYTEDEMIQRLRDFMEDGSYYEMFKHKCPIFECETPAGHPYPDAFDKDLCTWLVCENPDSKNSGDTIEGLTVDGVRTNVMAKVIPTEDVANEFECLDTPDDAVDEDGELEGECSTTPVTAIAPVCPGAPSLKRKREAAFAEGYKKGYKDACEESAKLIRRKLA